MTVRKYYISVSLTDIFTDNMKIEISILKIKAYLHKNFK